MSKITCPACANKQQDAILGIEVRGVYDGVLYWQCMACGHTFHRFPPEHYLFVRAEPYILQSEEAKHG